MIRQRGLSITELLIALAVGLFLTSAVFAVLEMSSRSSQSTAQFNQLQESARIALRLLEEDIAQVGFFSDLTGVDLIAGTNATAPVTASGVDCVGGGLNNGSFPNGSGNFRVLWAASRGTAAAISCESSALPGSDVLQVKRLEAAEIQTGTFGDRFYATVNINEIQFFNGVDTPPVLPGGRIYEYQHRVYYVANNDAGEPELVRHALTGGALMGSPEPLVTGVEAMQLEFGVDADGDGVVDVYLATADLAAGIWDQANGAGILSVRIHLLLRALSKDNSYKAGGTRTYQMPAGVIEVADDGYRRKRMSTTVALQNPWLQAQRAAL